MCCKACLHTLHQNPKPTPNPAPAGAGKSVLGSMGTCGREWWEGGLVVGKEVIGQGQGGTGEDWAQGRWNQQQQQR